MPAVNLIWMNRQILLEKQNWLLRMIPDWCTLQQLCKNRSFLFGVIQFRLLVCILTAPATLHWKIIISRADLALKSGIKNVRRATSSANSLSNSGLDLQHINSIYEKLAWIVLVSLTAWHLSGTLAGKIQFFLLGKGVTGSFVQKSAWNFGPQRP